MPERGAPGLTTRVLAGAVIVAVAVAAVVGLLVRSAEGLDEAQRRTLSSERTRAAAERAERAALDLELGLRGYLLTGEPRFLTPYRRARVDAPPDFARLRRLADTVEQRRLADALARAQVAYVREYAEPLIRPGGLPRNGDETVSVTAEGKRRIDAIRAGFERFDAVERGRLVRRTAATERSTDRAVSVGTVALIVLLGLVAGFALFVYRTVVRPVRGVAAAVQRMRGGDLDVRLETGGPRELVGLGESMNALGRSLSESRAELEASNAELRRLSDRNLVVLDSVFSQTPAGLALLDRELRYVRVNAAMAAMNGSSAEAHLGRRVDEVLESFEPRLLAALEQVLATGEAVPELEVRGRTPAEPGVTRDWSVTYYPVREQGSVVGIGAVVVDITERKRAEAEREVALEREREAARRAEAARERAAFLAEAGAVLDQSLVLDDTLAALGRLCVPRVADWCAFDLVEPGGRLRTTAVTHTDPEKVALANEYAQHYPPDPASAIGVPAVVRSGRPERYPEITEEMLSATVTDPKRLQLLLSLGMTSVMIVPLTARGDTFGAITFVAAESGHHFDEDEYALAQDLGLRAALALDNARLYRERTHVARTLQESLLPEVLPQIPGISLAARFEPLGSASEVGGDFYDVFDLDDGRWAVVIGDVCGKGAEAAALTALARYTLRAVAPLPPVEALQALNHAILRQRDDLRFITMVYAELDLRGAVPHLRMANGGHPPALLLHPDRPGEVLACPGTLIGVTPDPALEECSVTLGPGDTFALYTDGVTEASHATPLDGDAILAALGSRRSADAVADGLQGLAHADGASARDDVAVLTLQVA